EQWNRQPRFLDREALHLASGARPMQVQEIAQGAVADRIGGIPGNDGAGYRVAAGRHGQLAQLLRERHLPQQRVDSAHSRLPSEVPAMIERAGEFASTVDESQIRGPRERKNGHWRATSSTCTAA